MVIDSDIFEHCKEYPFFQLYYELDKHGETCPRFNFFSALSMLGSTIGRKVSLQRGSPDAFPTLYPNPWVMLVAPQGTGHKSSSLRMAKWYLMQLPEYARPRFFAAKITPEALVRVLATQVVAPTLVKSSIPQNILRPSSTGLIISSELGVFLGKEKYNTGMVGLLTDLYDCHDEWSSDTIMRGDQRLYNVCLSAMGATTPDWMQDMLPIDLLKGGFLSRWLIIAMPPNWSRRVGSPPASPDQVVEQIKEELLTISQIQGKVSWGKGAQEFFNEWYESSMPDPRVNPIMAYFERKQDHLLKTAILLQITKTYEKLVLEKESLETALKILDSVQKDTIKLLEFILTSPKMRGAHVILDLLRKYKRISESKLLQLCWNYLNHPREFEEFMMLLFKATLVKVDYKGEKGIYYTLTEEKNE